eukprot:ANDGO_03910.mRNA.1 hypothetical protein
MQRLAWYAPRALCLALSTTAVRPVVVVDVRDYDRCEGGHIPGSLHCPHDSFHRYVSSSSSSLSSSSDASSATQAALSALCKWYLLSASTEPRVLLPVNDGCVRVLASVLRSMAAFKVQRKCPDATTPVVIDRVSVVFHCMFSQQRGPSSAVAFLRFLDLFSSYPVQLDSAVISNQEDSEKVETLRELVALLNQSRIEVAVLEGGFRGWFSEFCGAVDEDQWIEVHGVSTSDDYYNDQKAHSSSSPLPPLPPPAAT